ncbi:hypothetical protein R6Q57_009652 [Mikania cordata]
MVFFNYIDSIVAGSLKKDQVKSMGSGYHMPAISTNLGCNFYLHEQCGKPKPEIEYPFSEKCVLKFQEEGSGAMKKTLEAALGLTLHLEKAAKSKCLHCGTKDLWSNVRGKSLIRTGGMGFFTGKSDPFRTIKEQFPEDMDRMHQLAVGRMERQTRKDVEAVLSAIFHVLTGNPFGLVGATQSYFGN